MSSGIVVGIVGLGAFTRSIVLGCVYVTDVMNPSVDV